jgi:hypothetical protein
MTSPISGVLPQHTTAPIVSFNTTLLCAHSLQSGQI